jgi:hypothetical protein
VNALVAIAGIGAGTLVFLGSAALWLQLQPMVAVGLDGTFPVNIMVGLSWAGMLLISPLLVLLGAVYALRRS